MGAALPHAAALAALRTKPTPVLRGRELCDLAKRVRPPTFWMGSVSSIAELRSDPERLLNSAGGRAELEQALLQSMRAMPVPPGAKTLVWDALGVQVVGTSAVVVSSSWASALWRGALKTLAASKAAVAVPVVMASLGVGAAGAAGALHYHYARSAAAPLASLSVPPAPSAQAASTLASDREPDDVESTSVEDSELLVPDAPTRAAPSFPPRDHLREESVLLARARAQLRGGDARAAQLTLSRMRTKFPRGALSQEREVLVIEALAARGNAAAAERNARTFIAEHPESPHAVQLLRRFME